MCIIITLFFFNDTATTEIYTLSLHDALPIYGDGRYVVRRQGTVGLGEVMNLLGVVASDEIHAVSVRPHPFSVDRKSTRLNSSHANISYAVFCLKKKKTKNTTFNHVYRKRYDF